MAGPPAPPPLGWAGLQGGDRGYVSVEGVAGRAAGRDLPTACACSDKFPAAGM